MGKLDWMARRKLMKKKYLELAEKAEKEGDHEKAKKLRIAAKRCLDLGV